MSFLDEWMATTDGHANSPEIEGNPAQGLFVTGTDTDVGKTYVSCMLVRQLAARGATVGVYKPVASGVVTGAKSDAERLILASGQHWPPERVCPQSFAAPLAPPQAAERAGGKVDEELLAGGVRWWRGRCDALVVEGVGGALSPLSARSTVLDLASQLRYPLIVVAAHRLGMINHTLLTLEAIERRGLAVAAIVVNEVSQRDPEDDQSVTLEESLRALATFCGNLPCWVVRYRGTALSRVTT